MRHTLPSPASPFPVAAIVVVAALATGLATPAAGQTAADSAGVRAAALDYIEGWYAGDAERMARALHPELVKRIYLHDPDSGQEWLDTQGRTRLVASTAHGGGSDTPSEERRTDVSILDIFRDAAAVRVDAGDWIDYLHLVRGADRWLIVNVLWELRGPPGR